MTYYIVGGGNILSLYDYMPLYSVISDNNYHRNYLVLDGLNSKKNIQWLRNTHHLFSFAYSKVYDTINKKITPDHIMIDSGGYSIHTLGLELTIDDYIQFLRESRYKYAFNFDIIRDPEQTYQNQKYIESHGLEVLPVFHLGDPYKHLQRYIDEGYKYISLGGMVGKHNKYREPFLTKCFKLGYQDGIKYHGLGISHKYAAKYPLYSIDNSNHIMVRRNGQMKIKGKNYKIPRVHGATRSERSWNDAQPVLYQLMENIKEYRELVKKNWNIYYQYFHGEMTIEEIIG